MRDMTTVATEVAQHAAEATEKEISNQLNELISRGLLIVRTQGPVLVQDGFSSKVSVRLAVRLELKDQEYIEKLEAENETLKEKLFTISKAFYQVEKL